MSLHELRCGKPMTEYRRPGRPPDPFPRCDRPAGHKGRCLSRWAYQNEKNRAARQRTR